MQTITIKNKISKDIIIKGLYNNDKECLEDAVMNNINLENTDLRHKNFQCANIDTAQLKGADLRYCNLNYANISESNLAGADLRGTSLVGTCIAETNLTNATMQDACFGATDIGYAILDGCHFSTLSALHLPFTGTKSMQHCVFHSIHGEEYSFSAPPIVIQGLFQECLYFIEKNTLIGHLALPLSIQDILNNQDFILSVLARRAHKI